MSGIAGGFIRAALAMAKGASSQQPQAEVAPITPIAPQPAAAALPADQNLSRQTPALSAPGTVRPQPIGSADIYR